MGISQSNVFGSSSIDISDYTILERRSEGLILRDQLSTKTYILRDHFVADKQHHDRLTRELSLHSTRKFKHILNVVGYERQTSQSICSSHYRISAVIEYTSRTLADEIKARKMKRLPFSTAQLFELTTWLVEAAQEALNSTTVTIMPKSIHITEDGQLKLRNSSLDELSEPDLQQYFSPERFEGSSWNRAQTSANLEREKQLIFGLALTVLSASLLEDCIDCYDFKQYTLRVSIIEDKVERCSRTYPRPLAALLSKALEFNPVNRISIEALQHHLREFSNFQLIEYPLPRQSTICDMSSIHYGPLYRANNATQTGSDFEDQSIDLRQSHTNQKEPKCNSLNTSTLSSCGDNLDTSEKFSNRTVEPSHIFTDGSLYLGMLRSGNMQGNGKSIHQNGSSSTGDLHGDTIDGRGRFFAENGKMAYDGEWKNQLYHGKGTHFNVTPKPRIDPFDFRNFNSIGPYWLFYRGTFVKNLKEGEGLLVLTNSEYYQGRFENDCAEGPGEYHCQDGTVIRGTWRSNRLMSC